MNGKTLLFGVLLSCLFASPGFSQQSPPAGADLIVGYYGRPHATSLGVLGQHTIEELIPIVRAKAQEYSQVGAGHNVTPAFHLIYGLATSDPGRRNDYTLPLSDKTLMEYINAAEANGFLVIIDSQLGAQAPVDAIKPVLKYLKYEQVHLAIDPEFEVEGLDVRPGKVIGHVTGEEINQLQTAMADYMSENGITGKKTLIVHMFRKSMVTDTSAIKRNDKIDLIMNLDGHGSPQLKVNVYNALFTADVASRIAGGFKLFFLEDKPAMMTPRQVMGLDPVAGKKLIKAPPKYINFQ